MATYTCYFCPVKNTPNELYRRNGRVIANTQGPVPLLWATSEQVALELFGETGDTRIVVCYPHRPHLFEAIIAEKILDWHERNGRDPNQTELADIRAKTHIPPLSLVLSPEEVLEKKLAEGHARRQRRLRLVTQR